MIDHLRNRHFFLLDIVTLSLAAYASFVLRLDTLALGSFWPAFILFALLTVGVNFSAAPTICFYWIKTGARCSF